MPEMETTINVLAVHYLCDACRIGKMIPTDKLFHKDGVTLFPHSCENCENVANYEINYPVIKYEGL